MGRTKKLVETIPAPVPAVPAVPTGVDTLLQTAITAGAGVEQLEKLLAMKYRHEEREAAHVFHDRFCEMQAELPPVPRTKEVKNYNGDVLYRYAPLEKIIETIKPYMKKYGFSYHWSESSEKENYKRVTCHITGHGHSESAYTDIPIMSANKAINDAQMAGSASTYGKRYSLSGLLGIMVDDDDDGKGTRPPKEKEKEKPEKTNTLTDDYVLTQVQGGMFFKDKKLGELTYEQIIEVYKESHGDFKNDLGVYGQKRFPKGGKGEKKEVKK